MAFGDVFPFNALEKLPVAGPLLSNVFQLVGLESSPEAKAQVKAMKDAAMKYQALRERLSQGMMTGLKQQMSIVDPVNESMQKMTGLPGFSYDEIFKNPLGQAPKDYNY